MPYAKIRTKQAKFTLEQLHAELAGKILDNRKEANRLRQAMKHVEAVLKLLEPGYDVRPIAVRRRKPNPWFRRGTVLRHILDMLRKAERPMTAREIALAMLAAKGVQNPPAADVRTLVGGVQSCLQNHNGRTVKAVGEGSPSRWSIAVK